MHRSGVSHVFLQAEDWSHLSFPAHDLDDPDSFPALTRRTSRSRVRHPHTRNEDVGKLGISSLEHLACLSAIFSARTGQRTLRSNSFDADQQPHTQLRLLGLLLLLLALLRLTVLQLDLTRLEIGLPVSASWE